MEEEAGASGWMLSSNKDIVDSWVRPFSNVRRVESLFIVVRGGIGRRRGVVSGGRVMRRMKRRVKMRVEAEYGTTHVIM